LKITAQKTSRKRQLQQWLLLILRMALFAMLGMAVASPVIGGGSLVEAYGTILLLLVGIGLLAMTAVLGANAMDAAKAKSGPASTEDLVAQTKAQGVEEKARAVKKQSPAMYWGLSAGALVAAILLVGYSTFALGSDRHFSSAAKGGFDGRSTACVIILDNSHSALARQGTLTRLQKAQNHIRGILSDTIRPAEAALLLTNPGRDDSAAITADATKIFARFENIEPLGGAISMRDRVARAVQLLESSALPNKMLFVISDFQESAFTDVEAFSAASKIEKLQIVLMPLATEIPPDLAISKFEIESGRPAVGTLMTFAAEVINNGKDMAPNVTLQLLVDGEVVKDPKLREIRLADPLSPGRDNRQLKKISYRLTDPGQHQFSVRVIDKEATAGFNDQRDLTLDVKKQIRVLVIGATDSPRYRTAPYYAMAALEPFSKSDDVTWSLAPAYRGVANVKATDLIGVEAIFLCDVPQIPDALAALLKSHVSAGKRLIIQTGPAIDAASYNAILFDKHRMLPRQLKSAGITAEGIRIDYVDTSTTAGVFADLYDSMEPFQRIVVTGRWTTEGETGNVMWRLADASPALIRHGVGGGEVFVMLTVPGADWSNLATQGAFVASMNRLAQGELGNARASKPVETGQRALIAVNADNPKLRLLLTSPSNITVEVSPTGNPPRWETPELLHAGDYKWESADASANLRGKLIVDAPAIESDLTLADPAAKAAAIPTATPAIVATSPEKLLTIHFHHEEKPLLAGVLAIVTLLLLGEALMSNRYRPRFAVPPSGGVSTRAKTVSVPSQKEAA
jgi:hypothetical protein